MDITGSCQALALLHDNRDDERGWTLTRPSLNGVTLFLFR